MKGGVWDCTAYNPKKTMELRKVTSLQDFNLLPGDIRYGVIAGVERGNLDTEARAKIMIMDDHNKGNQPIFGYCSIKELAELDGDDEPKKLLNYTFAWGGRRVYVMAVSVINNELLVSLVGAYNDMMPALLKELSVGKTVTATVVNLKRWEAELRYKDVVPMILKANNYNTLASPDMRKAFRKGQEIRVDILSMEINDENQPDIRVSHEKHAINPWPYIYKNYNLKDYYLAEVTTVMREEGKGYIVNLEKGIDAICMFKDREEIFVGDLVMIQLDIFDEERGRIKGRIITTVSGMRRRREA